MHTILLIGKMNTLLMDMNDYLRQYFTVQISTENPQSAVGMIKVTKPELILIRYPPLAAALRNASFQVQSSTQYS